MFTPSPQFLHFRYFLFNLCQFFDVLEIQRENVLKKRNEAQILVQETLQIQFGCPRGPTKVRDVCGKGKLFSFKGPGNISSSFKLSGQFFFKKAAIETLQFLRNPKQQLEKTFFNEEIENTVTATLKNPVVGTIAILRGDVK